MRIFNLIVRESKLNGPNSIVVICNSRKLVEVRVTDAELDEIENKVWAIVEKYL